MDFVEGVWFLSLVPTRNVTHDLARPWKRNGIITKRKRKKKGGRGRHIFPWVDSTWRCSTSFLLYFWITEKAEEKKNYVGFLSELNFTLKH